MNADTLHQLKKNFSSELARTRTKEDVARVKVAYLGRRGGVLVSVLRSLKTMPLKERRAVGALANRLRGEFAAALEKKERQLDDVPVRKHSVDVTAPGVRPVLGRLHPLTKVQRQVEQIFGRMGFQVVEGPSVETEFNNFDALNIPPWHPARDMWQTFWLKGEPHAQDARKNLLLRTHTSPVQVRYMSAHQPPFRIVAPGRCFRYEATDATHNFEFYQLEGLMVGGKGDPKVTLAALKAVLEGFLSEFFKTEVMTRFLPSYFPFVEPGVEVAMRCVACKGRGCSVCRKEGWIELLGAGMVHPEVFKAVGYDPDEVQGFAFGVGMDRLALMKYKIPDIRMLYASDWRFLKQF